MRSKLLFLMLVAGMLFLPAAAPAGVNLCRNPNFELDANGDENLNARPISNCLDWFQWGGGAEDEVQPAADHPAAKMMAVPGSAIGDEGGFIIAKADTVYYFMCEIKSFTGSAETATLYFEDSKWSNDVELAIDIPATGWVRYTHTLDTSENTAYVSGSIKYGIRNGGGTAMTNVYMGVGPEGNAFNPSPEQAEPVAPSTTVLSWDHITASLCDIYWNNGANDVNDVNFDDNKVLLKAGWEPNELDLVNDCATGLLPEKNYYWRVDCGDTGMVWHFTTLNQAPQVDAGPKQAGWLPSGGGSVTFQLAPVVSDDGLPIPPGTLTYNWIQTAGPGSPAGLIFTPPGASTSTDPAPAAAMTAAGDYKVQLTVTDGVVPVSDTVLLRVYDYSYTGLQARYDMEEGNAAAGIHDDYSGAPKNPDGTPGFFDYSNGTRRGERMDKIGDFNTEAVGKNGTTMDTTGGHNAQPEQDPCDLTLGGIVFNGGTGYVQVANTYGDPNENASGGPVRTWADFEDEVSVAAWVKIAQGDFDKPWQSIVCNGNTSWRLQQNNNTGALYFACDGTSAGAWGTVTIDDGRWHHVVGTYDGARIALYVDGVLDVSVESEGSIDIGNDWLTIGQNLGWLEEDVDGDGVRDGDDTVTDTTFAGTMDEVRIYQIGLPYTSEHDGTVSVVKIYQDLQGHKNCAAYLTGDADEDCYVDLKDVKLMAQNWLECNDIAAQDCDE